jgi:hypothetical protein
MYIRLLIISTLFFTKLTTTIAQTEPPQIVWESVFGSDSIDKIFNLRHTFVKESGDILLMYRRYLWEPDDLGGYATVDQQVYYLSLITQEGTIKWTKRLEEPGFFLRIITSILSSNDSLFVLSGQYYSDDDYSDIPIYQVTLTGEVTKIMDIVGPSEDECHWIHTSGDTLDIVALSYSADGDFPSNRGYDDAWYLRVLPEQGIITALNMGTSSEEEVRFSTLFGSNSYLIAIDRIFLTNSCWPTCSPQEYTLKLVSKQGILLDSITLEPYTYIVPGGDFKSLVEVAGHNYYVSGINDSLQSDIKIYEIDQNFDLVRTKVFDEPGDQNLTGAFEYKGQIILYGITHLPEYNIYDPNYCQYSWVTALDADLNMLWTTFVGEPCVAELRYLAPQHDGQGFIGYGNWIKSDKFEEDQSDLWMFKLDYPTQTPSDECGFVTITPNIITNDQLQIAKGGAYGSSDPYFVINALGQVIQRGQMKNNSNYAIELPQDLPAGMYWLRVTCEAGSTTQPFMKM